MPSAQLRDSGAVGLDLPRFKGRTLPLQKGPGLLTGGAFGVPNKALLAKRILLCSLFAGKETG